LQIVEVKQWQNHRESKKIIVAFFGRYAYVGTKNRTKLAESECEEQLSIAF